MSTWYETKKEDISLSDDKEEVYIYIDSDYSGAIWVSVKVEDIKKLID